MYKSPIEVFTGEMQTKLEDSIYSAVQKCGINVDGAELLMALQYDRGQYEKGYREGILEFAEKLKIRGQEKVNYYTPSGCHYLFENGTLCGYVAVKEAMNELIEEMVGK